MTWLTYAFASAVLLSASALIEKKILQRVHSIDFSAGLALSNFVFSIPFLFFIDWSLITRLTLSLIFITALLASFAFLLLTKGIRHLEISTVSPLLSLSPGSTAILAFIVLGETLSRLQIGGILLMIVGSYVLATHKEKSVLKPFQQFVSSRYIHFVLLSLLFYSMGAIFDRAILFNFHVALPVYIFFVHLFIALLFIPLASVYGNGLKGVVSGFKTSGPSIVLASLLTVGYRYFQMEALQLASVGLVSGVKRSSSFFTTLIGGELFHEHNLKRKLIASAIILLGIFCIIYT